jgi:hypothetical protein
MPFKSQAQRAKFYALKKEGKMDQATIDRWEKETGGKKLPAKKSKQKSATRPIQKKHTVHKPIKRKGS